MTAFANVAEELGRGCVSGEDQSTIGSSEPGAGSAMTDMGTSATPDGEHIGLIAGKAFCTSGRLSTHVFVLARWDQTQHLRGIGAANIKRGAPSFETGHSAPKMGGRGVPEVAPYFDHCRVPRDNLILGGDPGSARSIKRTMSSFGPGLVGNTAMCLGVVQGAYELARSYSVERQQVGRLICEGRGNQFANNGVQRVTSEASQSHGHERLEPDSHGFAWGEGTTDILRNTIASRGDGRSFDQRWTTSVSDAVFEA